MTRAEHVDVPIIGAGLSGIGAAAHLAQDLPGMSYAILECREASGGTWDPDSVAEVPLMDFSAGYVQRLVHTLPRQGTEAPWSLRQSYLHDALAIRSARLDDGVLRWS